MCGIFGWSFKHKARIPLGQREALASTLAVANSMRGDQSWGVYYLDRNTGKGHVRREVGDIAAVPGLGALGSWDTLFAHTRFATTGSVTRENQHPFKVGSILLAHNGVVFNHEELNHKHNRNCSVDSQHFAYHLDEGKPFNDIEAYGAIEWMQDGKHGGRAVYLCRMRGGSLSVFGIKNAKGKVVGCVWSSDRDHLESALGAARLECFPYQALPEGKVFTARDGVLWSTERELHCTAPTLTARDWREYYATQGFGWGDDKDEDKGTRSGSTVYRMIDDGLYVNEETGEILDTVQPEPPGAPDTEREESAEEELSVAERIRLAHKRRASYMSAQGKTCEGKKISEMTDAELQEYYRAECGC